MKCIKCGQEIEAGKLYCPVCGKEVQLVPDYAPLGNIFLEAENIEKNKEKEEAEKVQKKKQETIKKKKMKLIIIISVVASVLLIALISKLLLDTKNNNSFSYQLSKAEIAYSNSEYSKAKNYVNRAIELNSTSLDANLLLALLLVEEKNSESAIEILLNLIQNYPNSKAAYGQLIHLYDKLEKEAEIKVLLDSCQEESILKMFQQYIAPEPIAGLSSGSYNYLPKIDFYVPDESSIYYTIDGSEPTKESTPYTGPIPLKEGSFTVKAISINKKNMQSNVAQYEYQIELPPPETPNISPSSGQFQTNTKIIISVPDGCKAYYAFDKEPTIESTLYTEPINMPEGEHILKAILVNEMGKESYVASETYVLQIAENKLEEPILNAE